MKTNILSFLFSLCKIVMNHLKVESALLFSFDNIL